MTTIKSVIESEVLLEDHEVDVVPSSIDYFMREDDSTVLLVLRNGHIARTRLNVSSVKKIIDAL